MLGVAAIAIVEVASSSDADTRRFEKAGAHRGPIDPVGLTLGWGLDAVHVHVHVVDVERIEMQVAGRPHRGDSWKCPERFLESLEEEPPLFVRELAAGKADRHHRGRFAAEAGIDRLDAREASQKESRPHEQNDGCRHLRHHQPVPHRERAAPAHPGGLVFDGRGHVGRGGLKRGNEPEKQSGRHRHQQGKGEHRRVETEIERERDGKREIGGEKNLQQAGAETRADDPANER